MKPQDCGPRYSSNLRECANFAVWTIKKICKDIGPRPSAGEEELKAQELIAKQTGSAADTAETREFTAAPAAFYGWMKIDAVLLAVGALLLLFKMPVLTLVFSVAAFICFFGEFILCKELSDGFYKKQTSHNTVLTRKPSGEVKRRIVFCGHADSSYEWRYNRLGGAPLMYFSIIYAALGFCWNTVFGIVCIISSGVFAPSAADISWYGWGALVFIPSYVMLFFFINNKVCADGANDNLTGCLCSAAVLKFMDDNNIRFENTEVEVLLTGSSEAGLRGASAFVKQNSEKYKEVETMYVALDTLADYDSLTIYSKDMSGFVKYDMRCCNIMKKAAENAGLNLSFSHGHAVASDAAAAARSGISSTALSAAKNNSSLRSHTRDDKIDALNLKAIEKGIEIAVEAAFLFDETGLSK
ncbi:MAG: M28 family metallopeptidase [Clostridiales bacterium]|nr:M28 family metallopeptidase [Clostridiales bacterium]